jgi:hypothetical protein
VQLLRTIERDFVWSEALELKCALSTTITADDAQFSGTWTNPAGTVIQKLPVSPVLKDAIFHTLQSVLALVVQPQTATVKAWSGVMYTISDIRAFLQQRAENTAVSLNLLTLNELTFGPAVDLTALNTELSASAPASVASTQKAAPETTPARGVFALSQGALALLESFRTHASDNLQDTTDPHQVPLREPFPDCDNVSLPPPLIFSLSFFFILSAAIWTVHVDEPRCRGVLHRRGDYSCGRLRGA